MLFDGKVWKSSDSEFWLAELPFLNLTTQGEDALDALDMLRDAVQNLQPTFEFSLLWKDGVDHTVSMMIVDSPENCVAVAAFILSRYSDPLIRDYDYMHKAIKACVDDCRRMSDMVMRESTSAYGGHVEAPRWWWILRGALERLRSKRPVLGDELKLWEP